MTIIISEFKTQFLSEITFKISPTKESTFFFLITHNSLPAFGGKPRVVPFKDIPPWNNFHSLIFHFSQINTVTTMKESCNDGKSSLLKVNGLKI